MSDLDPQQQHAYCIARDTDRVDEHGDQVDEHMCGSSSVSTTPTPTGHAPPTRLLPALEEDHAELFSGVGIDADDPVPDAGEEDAGLVSAASAATSATSNSPLSAQRPPSKNLFQQVAVDAREHIFVVDHARHFGFCDDAGGGANEIYAKVRNVIGTFSDGCCAGQNWDAFSTVMCSVVWDSMSRYGRSVL